jgi:hypothetical protein
MIQTFHVWLPSNRRCRGEIRNAPTSAQYASNHFLAVLTLNHYDAALFQPNRPVT